MRKYQILTIIFFLSFSYVFGSNFNVGIYNLDKDLEFNLYEFCTNFLQYKFSLTSKEIKYLEDLSLYNKSIENNQQIKDSYSKNVEPKLEILKNEVNEYSSKINFIKLENVPNCDQYFIDGDKVLLNQICLEQNLSLIIIPQTVIVSGFIRYRIFVFNNIEKTFYTIYDRLLTKNQLEIENEDLLNTLLPLFYDNFCLVKITGMNFELTKVKPGNYLIHDNLVVLPSGDYTIGNYNFTVKDEKNLIITINKEVEFAKNILLNSQIGGLDLLVNNHLQFKTPFKLDEIEIPYTMKISKEGFKESVVQVSDNSSNFEFDLSPSWLETQNRYEEDRKSFYNSFALSIGLFAIRVVSKSLKEDNFKLYSGIDSIIYGVSIVNLLNIANKLFIYYKSSAFLAP